MRKLAHSTRRRSATAAISSLSRVVNLACWRTTNEDGRTEGLVHTVPVRTTPIALIKALRSAAPIANASAQ